MLTSRVSLISPTAISLNCRNPLQPRLDDRASVQSLPLIAAQCSTCCTPKPCSTRTVSNCNLSLIVISLSQTGDCRAEGTRQTCFARTVKYKHSNSNNLLASRLAGRASTTSIPAWSLRCWGMAKQDIAPKADCMLGFSKVSNDSRCPAAFR